MKPKPKYTLQRTMIIYFLLIGFASLLVSVEFVMDTHGDELKKELFVNFNKYSKGEIAGDTIFQPIEKLRNKAILMIAIILFVIIIILTMFIKNITEPLQHMIETSQKISGGDLGQTITIHSNNELAELGNVINDMSSNLQEIILLSNSLCMSGNNFISETQKILDQSIVHPEHIEDIGKKTNHLQTEICLLNEVINYFSFFSAEKYHDA